MAKAEAADQADIPDGLSLPDELVRRGAAQARQARAKIAARPGTLGAQVAEHQAQLAAREAKTQATGKKPQGQAARAADPRVPGRPIRSI
jgi:hypothetical protein